MTTKQQVIEALAWHLNYKLKGIGEASPFGGDFAMITIAHDDNADISFLEKLGIKVPNYCDEKHWQRGKSVFNFFLNGDIAEKISADFRANPHD